MPGLDLLPDLEGLKDYHPKKWTQRHRMCVALHLMGWTNNEIAEQMGWTASKVSITINDPRAEFEKNHKLAPIADVELTVSEKLEKISHSAFEKTVEIMEHADKDETQLKASLALLDRAGFTPIKREVRLEGEVPATPEILEQMRATLAESRNITATYKLKKPAPETVEEVQEADFTIEIPEHEQGQMESYVETVTDD